jgi:hypothetical protein
MPKNTQNTLSQQALKRYNHFKAVNTEALEWLSIIDKLNNHVKIPSLPEYHSSSLLDYIKVNILKPISSQLQKSSIPLPTVNKGIFSKLSHNLSYEAFYRRLSHICEKKLLLCANSKHSLVYLKSNPSAIMKPIIAPFVYLPKERIETKEKP